ncbi:MAG: hypothetical protein HY898_37065 [Deltaproteobacteria bacterium]|nr:hypothetical protein [Deltaproteobacteria bacterium]
MTIDELTNTQWAGRAELWLDPDSNDAFVSDCTMRIEPGAIRYTWSHEGKPQHGTLTLRAGGADFTDTFHSQVPMACVAAAGSWGLVDVVGTYTAGDGPPWGWRITVTRRPEPEQLVLQMTNIMPWGEHERAVRMVCKRV